MLAVGTVLGPYKILAPLGAGGMGEVYRARDARLGRDIALKVIRAEVARDPDRVRRFQQEARAASALNHPNVCAIYDIGTHDGTPFVVMELLEGESLRQKLRAGLLPARKAIDCAAQAAHGLAAAHEKGIIHRDLKPENLFVTRDGRVKVLDFGLAKLTRPEMVAGTSEPTVSIAATETGAILGTVGYMSPEQVRGENADARSDLFALGAILYEMLSGQRAFHGATYVETLNAILKEEPAPLLASGREIPLVLEPIVRRCLEKSPGERFQSASDLAFQLEALASGTSGDTSRALGPRARLRPWLRPRVGVGVLLLLVAGFVAGWIGLSAQRPKSATFERLTFQRGSLGAARYSPDGRTIVYSAAWDGEPGRIYTTRLDSHESSPLPLPEARLLSVSATGELAIAVGPGLHLPVSAHTTLARVPLAGGAPRELLDNVLDADWSPDGKDLAVVRFAGNTALGVSRSWLEYPIGRKLYQSEVGLVGLRVSPRGDRVALLEMDTGSDYGRGAIVIVDRAGRARKITPVWNGIEGMAWSPRGDEVWYTAVHRGSDLAVHAASLAGRDRLVLNSPGALRLEDTSRDGHVLLSSDKGHFSTMVKAPGLDRERDLSWLETTAAADLSPDGRTLVFTEWGGAAGATSVIGMRGTDGSPVVRLGDGYAGGLSPDGRWVVGILLAPKPHIGLLPTGVGQSRDLDPGPVRDLNWSCWAPDGKHVLFLGLEPGHGYRAYVQDVDGGPPRAFTPDGTSEGWQMVSPDGRSLLASTSGEWRLFPLDGGAARPVPGLGQGDAAVRWTADGRGVLVHARSAGLPARIELVDINTGARRLVRTIMPMDPVGVTGVHQIHFTSDLRAYAYSMTRQLSDLYQVQGLR